MMNRRCYACIKTSIEMSNDIKEITKEALSNPEQAYAALQKIATMNNKFNIQFKDTDPGWLPPNANPRYYGYRPPVQQQQQNQYQQQPQSTPAPNVIIYEMENDTALAQ